MVSPKSGAQAEPVAPILSPRGTSYLPSTRKVAAQASPPLMHLSLSLGRASTPFSTPAPYPPPNARSPPGFIRNDGSRAEGVDGRFTWNVAIIGSFRYDFACRILNSIKTASRKSPTSSFDGGCKKETHLSQCSHSVHPPCMRDQCSLVSLAREHASDTMLPIFEGTTLGCHLENLQAPPPRTQHKNFPDFNSI
ncbi:hypothetical protein CDAR_376281 [Caerostris darwini]|uniref:Uncharacterized protein n=1 Tax=Caerostris darwini TaxID=1538125 RepID=A0AAV4QNL7_9ARAC|nr:hypothetical protein CDAR_376281 [Caerostris darwini]